MLYQLPYILEPVKVTVIFRQLVKIKTVAMTETFHPILKFQEICASPRVLVRVLKMYKEPSSLTNLLPKN